MSLVQAVEHMEEEITQLKLELQNAKDEFKLQWYKECCEDLTIEVAKLHRELKTTESALELQVAINRKLQKARR